ncbi:hypothetical protein HDV02_005636 [Globomyces sp. JEL0801]|nr:hypothetical protein HDV02_005636 [Globomyces sp. JEL0801]
MTEIEPLFVQYLDTEPIEVDPTGCKDIADFIKKAQKEFSPELDEFPLNKLTLHRFTGTKLKGDIKIRELLEQSGFENTDLAPLLIRYADALLPHTKKTKTSHHSEERKKRWEELNPILIQAEIDAAEKSGKKNLKGSLAYSSLNWSLISPVYDHIIHDYSQTVKEVPQETMELLHNYIVTLTRRLSSVTTAKESQRLHFIAPILVYVSNLFGPEDFIQIVIEEDLNGVNVKANGHFEFMLKRNNKRICIVQAKKDDILQGMVQDLVGMEVVSDLNDLDTVYGIVTNYVEWLFLKSQNDKIEMDEDVLHRERGIPTIESLKRIAGKIYALLSDD